MSYPFYINLMHRDPSGDSSCCARTQPCACSCILIMTAGEDWGLGALHRYSSMCSNLDRFDLGNEGLLVCILSTVTTYIVVALSLKSLFGRHLFPTRSTLTNWALKSNHLESTVSDPLLLQGLFQIYTRVYIRGLNRQIQICSAVYLDQVPNPEAHASSLCVP